MFLSLYRSCRRRITPEGRDSRAGDGWRVTLLPVAGPASTALFMATPKCAFCWAAYAAVAGVNGAALEFAHGSVRTLLLLMACGLLLVAARRDWRGGLAATGAAAAAIAWGPESIVTYALPLAWLGFLASRFVGRSLPARGLETSHEPPCCILPAAAHRGFFQSGRRL